MQLYNECLEEQRKWGKQKAAKVFHKCISACYTPAFRTVVDGGLQRCEEEHKKAFQRAAELANAGTRPLPETPSDYAAWLETSVTEARQKLVECQGKIDSDGDSTGYGMRCVRNCKSYIDNFDKGHTSQKKVHFDTCLGAHKMWMEK